jgi:DNA mismatch repair protein MSH6
MIPKDGMNQEWDNINQQIKDVVSQFASHLQKVKKELKCSTVVYRDLGKDLYQIEVPKGVNVPRDWIQLSNTSVRMLLVDMYTYYSLKFYLQKVTRYWDSTVKGLVIEYKELLETKNAFVKKFSLQVYAAFDESYIMWLSAVQSIAELDALMGLAKGSMNMGGKS